jgi:hypothetical protein
MSIRTGKIRWRLTAVVVSLLLPAVLVPAAPAAAGVPASAAAGSCSLQPDSPELVSDGWRLYIQGGAFAFCDRGGWMEVLIREDVSGWWDRTVATRSGPVNERLVAAAPCQESSFRRYYVEIRVDSGGDDYKEQSERVAMNAYC